VQELILGGIQLYSDPQRYIINLTESSELPEMVPWLMGKISSAPMVFVMVVVGMSTLRFSRNVCWSEAGLQHATAPHATRELHTPDEIKKYAFVVVFQVGQLVGEVGEVVAHASLQVVANVTIDYGQRAAAALTYIR
jgi:hypothetical protein